MIWVVGAVIVAGIVVLVFWNINLLEVYIMLLTAFLAIVFCAAMAMMLFSAVAFIQENKFFSSAPKEVREVIYTEG